MSFADKDEICYIEEKQDLKVTVAQIMSTLLVEFTLKLKKLGEIH